MGAPRDVSAGTDPGAKVRGAGLSPRRKGWEGLCRPKCKELFSQEVAWVKQARQEPHSRDWGKGEARPVLLEQQQLWFSLWLASHQPPGDPEPPSLSGPALSRGAWGWWA